MPVHPFEDVINVFGDDLFRYLYPRRMFVFIDSEPVARAPGTRSAFRPEIGMSVLCESYRQQEEFIVYFDEYYPHFVQDNRTFMTFCATYAAKLIDELGDDVMAAALTVASMILELGAFCHVRGHPRFKYYSGICWADVFKFYLSLEFFTRYTWEDLVAYAQKDVKFYTESSFELVLEENRVLYKSDWLRMFDYATAVYVPGMRTAPFRIRTPTPTDDLEATDPDAEALEHHEETIDTEAEIAEAPVLEHHEETIDTQTEIAEAPVLEHHEETINTQAEIPVAPKIAETSEQGTVDTSIPTPKQPDSEPAKSTPESVPKVQKKREPISVFKSMIYDGDDPCHLLEILENKKKVGVLMKSAAFQRLVNETVENPEEKMENKYILEFVRLILMGNEDLAKFYIRATRYMTVTNEIRSNLTKLSGSDGQSSESGVAPSGEASKSDDSLPSGMNLGAIPKRRKRSAADRTPRINEFDEKLVKDFKRVVSVGRDPVGKEICENFEFPFNQKVLLDNAVFKSIMELTIRFPVKRWGNDWILKFMKSLISASVKPGRTISKVKATGERSVQAPGTVQSSASAEARKESGASKQSRYIPPGAATDATPDPTRPDDDIDSNPDSDEDQDDSKAEAVYADIVNLSSSFQQLLVDVVKEGSAPQGAEGQDQAKTSSKRKRKNRKRSKRPKSEIAPQPVKENQYEPPLRPSAKAISEGYSSHSVYGEGDLYRIIQGVASVCGTGQNLDLISGEASSNPGRGREVNERRSGNPVTPEEASSNPVRGRDVNERRSGNPVTPEEASSNPGRGMDLNERRSGNPVTPVDPGTGSQVMVTEADSTTTPVVSTGASALPTGAEMEASDHESAEGSDNDELGLQHLFDMIPSSQSDEVLEWIFRQILAKKPNFFETLQEKDIDEDAKKEFMKFQQRFPGSEN